MEMMISNNDSRAEIRMSGQFTFPDYTKFKSVLNIVKEDNISSITLDMAEVSFIDSAALGMLMVLYGDLSKASKMAQIRGARGQVDKILKMSKMDKLFSMVT